MASAGTPIRRHVKALGRCTRCPDMHRPVVTGEPVASPVLLVGQAPGAREIDLHRPFAWTAGRTMFQWFAGIGLEEEAFRRRVYMAAVCRCFPGKNPGGGDRVPNRREIANCAPWLEAEVQLLRPHLILPVGRLAIEQMMPIAKLTDLIGRSFRIHFHGVDTDAVPLPHPSGASPWHRTEPGKTLLQRALRLIQRHPAWQRICR